LVHAEKIVGIVARLHADKALPPVTVKGIRTAVEVYEVPWRTAGAPPLEEEFAASVPDTTAFVNLSEPKTV